MQAALCRPGDIKTQAQVLFSFEYFGLPFLYISFHFY